MPPLAEMLGSSALLNAGGAIMPCIAALSVLMWMLIVERYRYLFREVGPLADRLHQDWRRGYPRREYQRRRLRALLLKRLHDSATTGLGMIEVIAAVLPFLGLLGTVVGMIRIFDVMTVSGAGNTQGMAAGISQALFTTMAGLVTALSGLYFIADLYSRAEHARGALATRLAEKP